MENIPTVQTIQNPEIARIAERLGEELSPVAKDIYVGEQGSDGYTTLVVKPATPLAGRMLGEQDLAEILRANGIVLSPTHITQPTNQKYLALNIRDGEMPSFEQSRPYNLNNRPKWNIETCERFCEIMRNFPHQEILEILGNSGRFNLRNKAKKEILKKVENLGKAFLGRNSLDENEDADVISRIKQLLTAIGDNVPEEIKPLVRVLKNQKDLGKNYPELHQNAQEIVKNITFFRLLRQSFRNYFRRPNYQTPLKIGTNFFQQGFVAVEDIGNDSNSRQFSVLNWENLATGYAEGTLALRAIMDCMKNLCSDESYSVETIANFAIEEIKLYLENKSETSQKAILAALWDIAMNGVYTDIIRDHVNESNNPTAEVKTIIAKGTSTAILVLARIETEFFPDDRLLNIKK